MYLVIRPNTTPTDITDRGYTGHKHNDDIGLIYMNARYYLPSVGRFASADTIVPNAADPQSFNRFSYGYNNPIKYSDPTGHCVDGITTWACIVAGIVIATKVIDYAITIWDGYQAGRVLADPNSSQGDRMMAGLTVGLSILFEVLEPDDILPIGIPADDVARRAILNGAEEALAEGGPEAMEGFIRNNLGDHADSVLSKIDELAGITPPTNRGGLRNALGDLPANMIQPQAHHNLPWTHREWFAGPGRGLDVNDPQFGRWVEGNPTGTHQSWSRAYQNQWDTFISNNPNASRQDVLDFLAELLESGLYP